jgi:hypothetical protein
LPDLFTGSINFNRERYEEEILANHGEQWNKWMNKGDKYKYEVLGYPKIYITQPLEIDIMKTFLMSIIMACGLLLGVLMKKQ